MKNHHRFWFLLMFAAIFVFGSSRSYAIDPQIDENSRPLAKYEREPDRARMEGRIYVDPNTGELVAHPVTEKQRALEAKMTKALQEDQSGLPVRIDADGMMSIELDERYWDSMQEQVSESGERHVVCGPLGHDHNKHKANKTEHTQQAGGR
jgi:hypothetical protein